MKAISLWQPRASLWARQRKKNETRHWQILYDGALLVHAAKRIETDVDPELDAICVAEFGRDWRKGLPAGALIGICDRVICYPVRLINVDAQERAQGNYGPGRYAWQAVNMRELPAPIPWRGMQNLFDVPDQNLIGGTGLDFALEMPRFERQGKLL
jgi:activating signal cointegrator 1